MSEEDTTQDVVAETEVEETPDVKPESKGRDAAIAAERRKARAAEKELEQLRKDLAQRERQEAEAQGKWQELAEKAERRAEELEAKIAEREQREAVTDAASRLRFKNPTLAHRLLGDDDLADPERALKRLAKEEPYLIADPPERTGAAVGAVTASGGHEDPLAQAGAGLLEAIQARRAR